MENWTARGGGAPNPRGGGGVDEKGALLSGDFVTPSGRVGLLSVLPNVQPPRVLWTGMIAPPMVECIVGMWHGSCNMPGNCSPTIPDVLFWLALTIFFLDDPKMGRGEKEKTDDRGHPAPHQELRCPSPFIRANSKTPC